MGCGHLGKSPETRFPEEGSKTTVSAAGGLMRLRERTFWKSELPV